MEKCNKCIDENGDWDLGKCSCYDEIFKPKEKTEGTEVNKC